MAAATIFLNGVLVGLAISLSLILRVNGTPRP